MTLRLLKRGLYAVTPDWEDTPRLVGVTAAIIDGGAVCVQYRNKTATHDLAAEQARAIAGLCRLRGVTCLINDDVALALAVGADGVHIGRDDGECAALRSRVADDFIIGVSCYDDFERARAAARDGASYVAFGAMFASPTKPGAVGAPIALIGRARGELSLPVVGIGGITADNVPALVEAGADMAAVITDIYNADDPRERSERIAAAFDKSPS
ncbi:thiamine phosphate synthase [Uliginosibacterium sp. sgz301328]|uniref:thiamine phosphate synthase n=1 Tax=Uliginosibacterium sp. sgz301328 TaxID=3243764 RepID=UPI00359EE5EE